MTDKEWYAQLSTLVLEGIEEIKKGKNPIHNQYAIKKFIWDEETPLQRKAKIYRKIALNVSEALKYVGYLGGLIFLVIDGISWLVCGCDGHGYGFPIAMLFAAIVFGAIGLAAQIWYELID